MNQPTITTSTETAATLDEALAESAFYLNIAAINLGRLITGEHRSEEYAGTTGHDLATVLAEAQLRVRCAIALNPTSPEQEPEPDHGHPTDVVALFGHDTAGTLHVLMVRRPWPPFGDCRALPSGRVGSGETPLAAACRVLTEETGLRTNPANLTLVGAYADPRGLSETRAYTALLGHLAEPAAGSRAAQTAWEPVGKLLANTRKIAGGHRDIIRAAQRVATGA